MHDVDPKVFARLIKAEKKGKLIWQKEHSHNGKFEMVTNGLWTVVVEEIKDPTVRLALFSIFDVIIEFGESIEMAYGEIKRNEKDYFKEMYYHPEYATSAFNLTKLQIGSTGEHGAARFLFDRERLIGINPDVAELSFTSIGYTELQSRMVYLGENKEIMLIPITPMHDKSWEEILSKYISGLRILK